MNEDCESVGDHCPLRLRPSQQFQDVKTNDHPPMKFIINVSGLRFETFQHTVEQLPDSILGSADKRQRYWDPENKEFFFDRNRMCFEAILTYYQTRGILIRPATVPMNVFVNELRFFQLGQEALWKATEGYCGFEEKYERPKNRLQCKVWELFEYPDTSRCARVIAIISISIILLSVVLFCIETLPSFQKLKTERNSTTGEIKREQNPDISGTFIVEALCICWFTLEYLVRFLSSPNKWKFVTSVLNIIDLIAIIPFYISTVMANSNSDVSSIAILRIVRLVRVFRIFKLSRYSRGLQILGHTLRASVKELGLLLFFLCVGIILFSSAIYYAELGSNEKFVSIPDSFWWSIITMTTVGYGDYVPVTGIGKLVGCFCAITGVLFIAMPVPVIVSNFAYYYSKERNREMTSGIESKNQINGEDSVSNDDASTRSSVWNSKPTRQCNNGKIHEDDDEEDEHDDDDDDEDEDDDDDDDDDQGENSKSLLKNNNANQTKESDRTASIMESNV